MSRLTIEEDVSEVAQGIHKTFPAISEPNPTTLVIHCADPRLQEAHRRFIREDLALRDGEYIHLPMLGAVACVAAPGITESSCRHFMESLDFCFAHFRSLTRTICINHEGCAMYAKLVGSFGRQVAGECDSIEELQVDNLSKAGKIARSFGGRNKLHVTAESYFLRFASSSLVFFEKIG